MIEEFVTTVNDRNIPVAIIVGASGGVGKACARKFASKGHATLLLGRKSEVLKSLTHELWRTEADAPSCHWKLDLCETSEIADFSERIAELQTASVLVLAAGRTSTKTATFHDDELEQLVKVNLIAPMVFVKYMLPIIGRTRNPYIINIASRAGVIGFADKGLYGATKAAVIRYFDSLRAETESSGLRISSICPGWINTPMAVEGGCILPAATLLQPEDIASTIEWLTSSHPRVIIKDLIIEVSSAHSFT